MPWDLTDLVLDPRVGIHVAVLAAARRQDADTAVMTTTGNAAANVAAYGQHFTEHDGLRLLYALHGHVPYDEAARPRGGHVASGIGIETHMLFETWFLPLVALKEKNGIRADQLPALRTYFRRAAAIAITEPDQDILDVVRRSIVEGDPGWLGSRSALATAMADGEGRPDDS